jgi:hypothetical protein
MEGSQIQPGVCACFSVLRRCLSALGRVVGYALVLLVRAYQVVFSPLLPRICRFEPSCSQYMIEAIRKKGPLVGVLKGLWRVVRCNPLSPGGYDPVE